jgi:hypothetical protein
MLRRACKILVTASSALPLLAGLDIFVGDDGRRLDKIAGDGQRIDRSV